MEVWADDERVRLARSQAVRRRRRARGLEERSYGCHVSLFKYIKMCISNLFVFPLEFVDKVVDQTVVKVLTTQVCVTSGRLDFEDAFFDG